MTSSNDVEVTEELKAEEKQPLTFTEEVKESFSPLHGHGEDIQGNGEQPEQPLAIVAEPDEPIPEKPESNHLEMDLEESIIDPNDVSPELVTLPEAMKYAQKIDAFFANEGDPDDQRLIASLLSRLRRIYIERTLRPQVTEPA